MSTRYYQAPDLNIEYMGRDLEGILQAQGYQTQHFGDRDRLGIQLKKGGDIEAFLGLQAALTVVLQRVPGGIAAALGEQQWIDKAAVGLAGFFLFPPLIFTAGAGVIRQAEMENQLFSALDMAALRQRANVHIGPLPSELESQMQQSAPFTPPFGGAPRPQQASWGDPRAPHPPHAPQGQQGPQPGPQSTSRSASDPIPMPPQGQKLCSNCQTPYEADDAFCSHCGKSLKPVVKHCAECHAELKPNAEFCTKCGTPVAAS